MSDDIEIAARNSLANTVALLDSGKKMPASRMLFEIGNTVYGQRVTATFVARDYQGRACWEITKHAAGQRDDTVSIYGITDDQILALYQALQTKQGASA